MTGEGEQHSEASLYLELAELAQLGGERGQTRVTATKETIDDDRESVWFEALDRS